MGEEKQIIMYANLPEPQKLIAEKATGEYHLIAHSEGLVSMTVNLPLNVNSVVDFYFNRHIHKEVQAVNGVATLVAIKSEDGDVEFPTEVLREPGFTVSIIYENENNQITTNYVFFPVYTNGIGEEPLHYDDDSYIDAKIAREAAKEALQEISELNDSVTEMEGTLTNVADTLTTLTGEVDNLKKKIPFWGDTKGLYINAQTGNDNNDGLSATNPIATLERAIEIINEDLKIEYNLYFMTSDTYIVPTTYPVLSAYPIHFFNYKIGTDAHNAGVYSIPTILFNRLPNANSAPRFYSSQVHFEGTRIKSGTDYFVYPIKIDCTWGHLYFENCSTYMHNVEFLCPISYYRCQVELYNCSYSGNNTTSTHLQNYQCRLIDCLGNIMGYIFFKGTESNCKPMSIENSHLKMTPLLTLMQQNGHYRNLNLDNKTESQQIIKISFSTCDINESVLPEYLENLPTLPYQITDNNRIVGGKLSGKDSGQILNAYDYLIVSSFSTIDTVRSFYRNVNRITGPTDSSYYTDKIYLEHSAIYADGVQLQPDYPNQEGAFDNYLANGFITASGTILYLYFTMPNYYSDRRYFPEIIADLSSLEIKGDGSSGEGSAVREALLQSGVLETASSYGENYRMIRNNIKNDETNYSTFTRFNGNLIEVKINLPESFTVINNVPLLFWFKNKIYFKWTDSVRTKSETQLYSTVDLTGDPIATIPKKTFFDVDGWQYVESRYGSCLINNEKMYGYITPTVLPS